MRTVVVVASVESPIRVQAAITDVTGLCSRMPLAVCHLSRVRRNLERGAGRASDMRGPARSAPGRTIPGSPCAGIVIPRDRRATPIRAVIQS